MILDQLLFQACAVAESYGYDEVERDHLLYALLCDEDRVGAVDLGGLNPDEIRSNLSSAFCFWRSNFGVGIARLTISAPVMNALEATQETGEGALFSILAERPPQRVRSTRQPVIPDPLPDLYELLQTVEKEQAGLGFEGFCKDVFPSPSQPGRTSSQPEGPAPDHAADVTGTDRKTGSASDRATLSSKERAEAKRAVERSIRDLTRLHRTGHLDPVIGRDREIDQVCQVLMRRRKSNVLLVGEPGVGKTALMEGVAARIATSPDPAMSERPVLQASLGALVAGARYRGDFEVRMELLVEHALERRAVLFFDEMQMLIGSGATTERGMDGANLLKPVLARDGMSLVGATTTEEARVIAADPALMRRFETIIVNEPCPDLMRQIIAGAAPPYLTYHGVKASAAVLDRLIDFADRYLPDRHFPDKGFDLLDATCVQARLGRDSRMRVENIRTAIRQLGGTLPTPDMKSGADIEGMRSRLVTRISDRVGGHDEAVRKVVDTVCQSDGVTPTLLHLDGPMNIGRRTLARALAQAMGSELLEIDAARVGDLSDRSKSSILRKVGCPVVLVDFDTGDEVTIRDLSRSLSADRVAGPAGRRDLRGAIILLRRTSERASPGFQSDSSDASFEYAGIVSIKMPPFMGDSLDRAVSFELARLSRLWSDAGASRPIPDVKAITCDLPNVVISWSEVVSACRERAGH